MSEYFSAIAARNTQSENRSVSSSSFPGGWPLAQTIESSFENSLTPDISGTFLEQSPNFTQPGHQDVMMQTTNVLHPQSVPADAKETKTKNLLPYITKHVERMVIVEGTGNSQSFPSASFSNVNKFHDDDLSRQANEENLISDHANESKNILRSGHIQYDGVHKIKNQTKTGENFQSKDLTDKHPVVLNKLVPVAPLQHFLSKGSAKDDSNKNTPSSPKLIIGKIIIEVLPPSLPVPPKIVTRTAQSTSHSNHSKINRLSFGLGQM